MHNDIFLIELNNYVQKHLKISDFFTVAKEHAQSYILREISQYDLEEFINNNSKPSFNLILFNFIDNKGFSDSDIYKKAGIDRRHFHKIRTNPNYKIGKNTVISLALSLELNIDEANKLLTAAGYSLSENNTFDLVIQFCIERKIYDAYTVNKALDYFSLKPLVGAL